MYEMMIKLQIIDNNPFEDQKGNSALNPFADLNFKKCCKKYKKGKRCKKCPGRLV